MRKHRKWTGSGIKITFVKKTKYLKKCQEIMVFENFTKVWLLEFLLFLSCIAVPPIVHKEVRVCFFAAANVQYEELYKYYSHSNLIWPRSSLSHFDSESAGLHRNRWKFVLRLLCICSEALLPQGKSPCEICFEASVFLFRSSGLFLFNNWN